MDENISIPTTTTTVAPTTTTTTILSVEDIVSSTTTPIHLNAFLGIFSLTRAEKLYYTKMYDDSKPKTVKQWSRITKLVKE